MQTCWAHALLSSTENIPPGPHFLQAFTQSSSSGETPFPGLCYDPGSFRDTPLLPSFSFSFLLSPRDGGMSSSPIPSSSRAGKHCVKRVLLCGESSFSFQDVQRGVSLRPPLSDRGASTGVHVSTYSCPILALVCAKVVGWAEWGRMGRVYHGITGRFSSGNPNNLQSSAEWAPGHTTVSTQHRPRGLLTMSVSIAEPAGGPLTPCQTKQCWWEQHRAAHGGHLHLATSHRVAFCELTRSKLSMGSTLPGQSLKQNRSFQEPTLPA